MGTYTLTDGDDIIGIDPFRYPANDPGPHSVFGAGGNDGITGSGFNDSLDGGDGDDNIRGLDGSDTLIGGDGNDYLQFISEFEVTEFSTGGGDTGMGGAGSDLLDFFIDGVSTGHSGDGGDGLDSLVIRFGSPTTAPDVLIGFFADLTALWTGGVGTFGGVGLSNSITDVEHLGFIIGSRSTDTIIIGNYVAPINPATGLPFDGPVLSGNNGNDYISGGNSSDTINGGSDDDVIFGNGGDDTIGGGNGTLFDGGTDIIHGGAGNDSISVTDGSGSMVFGDGGNDVVFSVDDFGDDVATNTLDGGAGDDLLYGATQRDILIGGEGNDGLQGGGSNDDLDGGTGNDSLSGDAGNDLLTAGEGDDFLAGGAGNDTLHADGGNDRVFGGNGDDLAYGGAGDDMLDDGQLDDDGSADTFHGEGGDDILFGQGGDDTLIGGDGSDTLQAGSGNDILNGGAGRDVLRGDSGSNTFVFTAATDSTPGIATRDEITDFRHGIDSIDVSGFDANANVAGVQSFRYIADARFSQTAGELRYSTAGLIGLIEADTDGDGNADFQVNINTGSDLTASDFGLVDASDARPDAVTISEDDKAYFLVGVAANDAAGASAASVVAINYSTTSLRLAAAVQASSTPENFFAGVINAVVDNGQVGVQLLPAVIDTLELGRSAEFYIIYELVSGARSVLTVTVSGTDDLPSVQFSTAPASEGNVAENGTVAGIASVQDVDSDIDADYTFTLGSGADNALFTINPIEGSTASATVSFVTPPDFENPADVGGDNIYDFTLTATAEEGTGEIVAPLDVALSVTDVDESGGISDTFMLSEGTGFIFGNQLPMIDVVANDGSGAMLALVGAISVTSNSARFNALLAANTIDDVATVAINEGQIALTFGVQFDAAFGYGFNGIIDALSGDETVEITIPYQLVDGRNSTLTVTVTGADDTPYVLYAAINGSPVPEDQTLAGQILIADPDSVQPGYDFRITGGDDAPVFTLVPAAGNAAANLTFTSSADFERPNDRTQDNGYVVNIGIVARDGSGSFAIDAIEVLIGDVLDTNPAISGTPDADRLVGTAGSDLIDGLAGADTLIAQGGHDIVSGGLGRDYLIGQGGDDRLSGGTGEANTLQGGIGNDTYIIEAIGDSTVEFAGEGIDIVRTSFSHYVLQANVENLTFIDNANHGAGIGNGLDNVITGGTGADALFGRDGNDTLFGGSGAANTLIGGEGDDIYVVAGIGDTIIERAGEGTDTVQTSLALFTLRDNVEVLTFTSIGAFTGIGGSAANRITGGAGDDFLSGRDGDDVLTGGMGLDFLIGGAGADIFRIANAADRDRVFDFVSGTDKIALDGAVFTHTATIDYVAGTVATSTNSTFLYNSGNGILSYDADGTGSGAAVAIANMGGGAVLSVGDFMFY